MIDLNAAWVRAALEGVRARISTAAKLLDWADGKQVLDETDLAPAITDPHARKVWSRLAKQVQSLGPRIVAHKTTAAIGAVNWGGRNPGDIDDRLSDLDLDFMAADALKHLCAVGIAGVWAYQPEVGPPKLQKLGGYLEPLYEEGEAGGEPAAIFQALSEARGDRYRMRVYEPDPDDPRRGTIYEWRNQRDPAAIGVPPTDTFHDQLMPRIVMLRRDQSGLPIGELETALPLLLAEVAQQLRELRAADSNASPLKWMRGEWDLPAEGVGPDTVLVTNDPAAQIGRLEPPTLDGLFALHDRLLERIRGDLQMPVSSITTGTFPSGEALDQANAAALANASMYARLLSRLLSAGVRDYAALLGIAEDEAPQVAVIVNREQMRRVVSEQARADYQAGLISLRAAVLAVAPYYPHWSDREIEEWLAGQERRVTVADLGGILGAPLDDTAAAGAEG